MRSSAPLNSRASRSACFGACVTRAPSPAMTITGKARSPSRRTSAVAPGTIIAPSAAAARFFASPRKIGHLVGHRRVSEAELQRHRSDRDPQKRGYRHRHQVSGDRKDGERGKERILLEWTTARIRFAPAFAARYARQRRWRGAAIATCSSDERKRRMLGSGMSETEAGSAATDRARLPVHDVRSRRLRAARRTSALFASVQTHTPTSNAITLVRM